MNSYPHEFLGHPKPLMFVAGLSPKAAPIDQAPAVATTDETGTGESSTSSAQPGAVQPEVVVDEFEQLKANCRQAFEPFSGKSDVWAKQEGKERKFHVQLVDKTVRLPPRKVVATQQPNQPAPIAPTPRSPLSPLLPGSPLHPDGLIAPVWVRKHSELVPSVFVLFLKLWEAPAGVDDNVLEREMDDQLVKEITERKRRVADRGIKLTVVLMASRDMLENPNLDPRLSYLRRTSQLDTRASLFVLTPVPQASLVEFVGSLQDALIDSGIEFYASHAKRIRRKRGRTPAAGATGPKRLGPQGWQVRYDYKAGWFAEVRGEIEVARRHYEDCWTELAKMFGSTTTLPPRTKRWAEAKVLVDCVAIKICKLFLYGNEGARALSHFHAHLHRFGDLLRGWGIGEETFEFWSWIARQYRIFAELLELGLTHNLTLPSTLPPTLPTQVAGTAIVDPTIPTSSTNPLHVLQRPGFYYYKAACCSIERKKRFDAALEIENDAMSSETAAASGYVSAAPGFANEKKVGHAALIVELFTKAYSLTKEQTVPQARLALFIAFRIAETYSSSGQWEMAMRFFDRIAKTYQRDRWDPIVAEIRALWYDCAQRTGAVEVAARLLLEMMGQSAGAQDEEWQESLISLLQTTTPPSPDVITVELPEGSSLLIARAGFWQPSAFVGSITAFQVSLEGAESLQLSFSRLAVTLSGHPSDIVLNHEDSSVDWLDVGQLTSNAERQEMEADLKWGSNRKLVLQGSLMASNGTDLTQIDSIKLRLSQGSWNIDVVIRDIRSMANWTSSSGHAGYRDLDLSPVLHITSKPHLLKTTFISDGPAYVGEPFKTDVVVQNDDDRALQVTVTVLLQPTEEDDELQMLTAGDESSPRMLKEVPMGVVQPGESSTVSVQLLFGLPGDKVVEVSVSSSLPGSDDTSSSDFNESHHTIQVPALLPFAVTHDVAYRASRTDSAPLLASAAFEDDYFDKLGEAVVNLILNMEGPRELVVESFSLEENLSQRSRLISDSLAISQASLPDTWQAGDKYGVVARFDIGAEDEETALALPPSPAQLVVVWKSRASLATTTTRIALPALVLPPAEESFINVLYHAPPSVTLHEPFDVELSLANAHPSVPASALSLEISTSDSFAWVGSEIVKVPLLLPGQAWRVRMRMVAVGNVGWCPLPTVTVLDGEGEHRQVRVRVMDARLERVDLTREHEDVLVFVKP